MEKKSLALLGRLVWLSVILFASVQCTALADPPGDPFDSGSCSNAWRVGNEVWRIPRDLFAPKFQEFLDLPDKRAIARDLVEITNMVRDRFANDLIEIPHASFGPDNMTVVTEFYDGVKLGNFYTKRSRLKATPEKLALMDTWSKQVDALEKGVDKMLAERYPKECFPLGDGNGNITGWKDAYRLPSGNLVFADNHYDNILVVGNKLKAFDPVAVMPPYSPSLRSIGTAGASVLKDGLVGAVLPEGSEFVGGTGAAGYALRYYSLYPRIASGWLAGGIATPAFAAAAAPAIAVGLPGAMIYSIHQENKAARLRDYYTPKWAPIVSEDGYVNWHRANWAAEGRSPPADPNFIVIMALAGQQGVQLTEEARRRLIGLPY